MRKKHEKLEVGATRIITKFLWSRKRIGYETRWLEKASFEQKVIRKHGYFIGRGYVPNDYLCWSDSRWIND